MKSGSLLLSILWFAAVPVAAQAPPHRLVSMSPHYTSILYDIGAQDLLVGVTDYCRYPAEAASKERIGGFLDPNIEKVVRLKPDLVLMLPAHGERVRALRELGIPVFVMENDRLEDVWTAYDRLGKVLGREKEARQAKERLRVRFAKVRKEARKRPGRTALFVAGKDAGSLRNIYAAGPGTFPHDLMRMAGVRNVVGDSKLKYPLVSKEEILRRDPDLIFQAPPEGKQARRLAVREKASWSSWKDLKAVRERRIYVIPDPSMLVPGPGSAALAEFLLEKAR